MSFWGKRSVNCYHRGIGFNWDWVSSMNKQILAWLTDDQLVQLVRTLYQHHCQGIILNCLKGVGTSSKVDITRLEQDSTNKNTTMLRALSNFNLSDQPPCTASACNSSAAGKKLSGWLSRSSVGVDVHCVVHQCP